MCAHLCTDSSIIPYLLPNTDMARYWNAAGWNSLEVYEGTSSNQVRGKFKFSRGNMSRGAASDIASGFSGVAASLWSRTVPGA
jgi:hypothetical protein